MHRLFDIVASHKLLYLSVFLVSIMLRGIPELLVPQYPIGYETITYYAPAIMTFSKRSLLDVFADAFQANPLANVDQPLLKTFRAGPLFYVLIWPVSVTTEAHAYSILKVVGPLLYGCLAVSFFVFLKRGLDVDGKMAFVAALLLIFQVAALRESWDRFRNVLGLIFAFATLTALRSDGRFKWPFVAGLAVLTALSREYIGLVLFVAVLGFAFLERKHRAVSFIALAPALVVFAVMVYPTELWWNYVAEGTPPHYSGNYLSMLQDVSSIFAVCYIPLLPFVVKGFKRYRLLDPALTLLFLGSFSVVISPWFAVRGYQRWLVLLVFPFSVYAARGFKRLHLFGKDNLAKLVVILLIFMVVGAGYSSGAFSYVMLPNSWVPPNLVQSSIAWSQIDDVKDVLKWLDENAVTDSSILSEERFYGWTLIYLQRANNDVEVIPYGANSPPEPALEKAVSYSFSWIYLIWYTDSSLEGFEMVYSQNRISIFQYEHQPASL